MKKIIVLCLILSMVLSLSGCASLSVNNVSDYLAFDIGYTSVRTFSTSSARFGNTSLVVNTYPVKGGTFDNVEITLEVTLPGRWFQKSEMDAYGYDYEARLERYFEYPHDETVTLKFRLPATGEYTITEDLVACEAILTPTTPVEYKVVSVTGEFKPS